MVNAAINYSPQQQGNEEGEKGPRLHDKTAQFCDFLS